MAPPRPCSRHQLRFPIRMGAHARLQRWELSNLGMNHNLQEVSESHLSLVRKRRRWVGSGEEDKYNRLQKGRRWMLGQSESCVREHPQVYGKGL